MSQPNVETSRPNIIGLDDWHGFHRCHTSCSGPASRLANNCTQLGNNPLACLPAMGFLFWIRKEHRSPMAKAQNIVAGLWIVSSSTALAHLLWILPAETTTTLILSTGIELPLGLLLYHVTRRLYRKGRQLNIATSSGMALDDAEVRNLADNQDLAIAVLAAMVFTTKSIILMQSNFVPYLTPEAARVIGILLGSSTGLMTFNFCPSQTKIREFIARCRNSEG